MPPEIQVASVNPDGSPRFDPFVRETVERKIPPVVGREEWGAYRPRMIDPADLPIDRVFFTLYTDTPECNSKEECMKIVKALQVRHMTDPKVSDIKYNFLIGGDGRVYVGRGWFVKPSRTLEFNPAMYDKRLDIAYIGDFRNVPNPPFPMVESAMEFVAYGEWLKHIRSVRDFHKLPYDQLTGV